MKNKIICDIDGTLADCGHRLHFITPPKEDYSSFINYEKEWEKFFEAMVDDTVIDDTYKILDSYDPAAFELYFITGRPQRYQAHTFAWLQANLPPKWQGFTLGMRQDGDHRPDFEVKEEMINEPDIDLTPENVVAVYEDSKPVIEMFRRRGFNVVDMSPGKIIEENG